MQCIRLNEFSRSDAVPSKWTPPPQNIFLRNRGSIFMIWRAYLIYKTPRFKSCFNHSLIDSELQSWAGTQLFFLFFLSLLWIKLVLTKLYFSACKPYHNNNKIHVSICKIRALRMNKFITTQESIGKNRFTDGLQIVAVNMFSISLWKNHFGTQGRTLCINFSVGSRLL